MIATFRRSRLRLSQAQTAISRHSRAVAAAIAGVIGPDEILLGAGLTLVTVALWPVLGRVSLIVPGLVILWIAVPERAPFVTRPPVSEKDRRKT